MITFKNFRSDLADSLEYMEIEYGMSLWARQKNNGQLSFDWTMGQPKDQLKTCLADATTVHELLLKTAIIAEGQEIDDATAKKAAAILHDWMLGQK
jgi:hypothetical protein